VAQKRVDPLTFDLHSRNRQLRQDTFTGSAEQTTAAVGTTAMSQNASAHVRDAVACVLPKGILPRPPDYRSRLRSRSADNDREDYFFVAAAISRKRRAAALGPKSSKSKKGRISHSLSPPRRNGASTCTKRLVHSIASAFDVNWRIA
jgi:hypothetical protein